MAAHQAGLKVLLRPLIDETNLEAQDPSAWRGILKPTDLATWFSDYFTTLEPYLALAARDHVEHVAIETELDSLASDTRWAHLIAESRKVYGGNLVWNYSWNAADQDRPSGDLAQRRRLPAPALALDRDDQPARRCLGTAPDLRALQGPRSRRHDVRRGRDPPQDGAYRYPFSDDLPLATYPFDEVIQVRWFTAACDFVRHFKLRGIYFWGPWLAGNSGSMLAAPDPARPVNIQPATRAAISSCFKG